MRRRRDIARAGFAPGPRRRVLVSVGRLDATLRWRHGRSCCNMKMDYVSIQTPVASSLPTCNPTPPHRPAALIRPLITRRKFNINDKVVCMASESDLAERSAIQLKRIAVFNCKAMAVIIQTCSFPSVAELARWDQASFPPSDPNWLAGC